jgi:hypothetical protein
MPTFKDPLNQREIPVKSIYVPTRTLLQGKPYTRNNILQPKKP